jgi:hypothetical protein
MYMVYWTIDDGTTQTPHAQAFATAAMGEAMKFMEALRTRQRAGEGVRFVVMASEHPHSVGHPGVADPSPDYAWKKRRR